MLGIGPSRRKTDQKPGQDSLVSPAQTTILGSTSKFVSMLALGHKLLPRLLLLPPLHRITTFISGSIYDYTRLLVCSTFVHFLRRQSLLFDIIPHSVQPSSLRPSSLPSPFSLISSITQSNHLLLGLPLFLLTATFISITLQTRIQHNQKCSEKSVVPASQLTIFAQHVPA